MRAVLDTNIFVSALWEPRGPSGRIVDRLLAGDFTVLFDGRLVSEVREVLSRPKFEFDPERVAALVGFLESTEPQRRRKGLPRDALAGEVA